MGDKDPVTEKQCETREGILHRRISQRPTLVMLLAIGGVLVTLIFGGYSYTYLSTDKLDAKQWDMVEKMVTKEDLGELKQDIKDDLSDLKQDIKDDFQQIVSDIRRGP